MDSWHCIATTKRGTRCRRAAGKGSKYCASHRPKQATTPAAATVKPDVGSDADAEELLKFVDQAREDLIQLGRMKGQFCSNGVSTDALENMAAEEGILQRIVHEMEGGLSSSKACKAMDVPALRQAFGEHHTALTRLILTKCSVRLPEGKLGSMKQAIREFFGAGAGASKGPCANTPRALRRWFGDKTDRVWKNKQILCSHLPEADLQMFRPGQVLWDGYEVVVVDAQHPRWIGVAQRRSTADAARAESSKDFLGRLLECMQGSARIGLQFVRLTLTTLNRLLRMAATLGGKLPRFLARMLLRFIKYGIIILIVGSIAYPAILKIYPPILKTTVTGYVNDSFTVLASPQTYLQLTPEAANFTRYTFNTVVEAADAWSEWNLVKAPQLKALAQAAATAAATQLYAWGSTTAGNVTDMAADMKGSFDEVVAGYLEALGRWWTPPGPQPARPASWKYARARTDGEMNGLATLTNNPEMYKKHLEVLRLAKEQAQAPSDKMIRPPSKLHLPEANWVRIYLKQHPEEAEAYIEGFRLWERGIGSGLDRLVANAKKTAVAAIQKGQDFVVFLTLAGKKVSVKVVDARDSMDVKRKKLAAYLRGGRNAYYFALRAWLDKDGKKMASAIATKVEDAAQKAQTYYNAHGHRARGLLSRHFLDPAGGIRRLHATVMGALSNIWLTRGLPTQHTKSPSSKELAAAARLNEAAAARLNEAAASLKGATDSMPTEPPPAPKQYMYKPLHLTKDEIGQLRLNPYLYLLRRIVWKRPNQDPRVDKPYWEERDHWSVPHLFWRLITGQPDYDDPYDPVDKPVYCM